MSYRLQPAAQLLLLVVCLHSGWTAMCPYGGWLYSQNSCYNFFNAKFTRTWEDARQRCLEQDADLVTIETTPERDWVLRQTRLLVNYTHNSHHSWWIGLNARPDGATWKWPNSTSVNISLFQGKWARGQPLKDRRHQCVGTRDGTFTVARCGDTYQVICERDAGRPLTCDPGWTLFAGMCYKYFTNALNFQGARSTCHRRGATLPQVSDSDTQTTLWNLARTKGQNFWISLYSVQQGNSYVWKWSNGSSLTQPTFWNRAPPHSLGSNVNKTCVEQLQGGTATKSWNTVPCSVRRQFFCQKPEGSCPNGWLQLTNRCFFIYARIKKSFPSAQSYCSGLGAALVSFDSSDTSQFLWPYIHNARAAGASTLWIGLTDNNQDSGPWKWTANNKTLGRWNNWPNHHVTNTRGRQDCVAINSNDRNLRWHATASCGSPHAFICQLPVNKALRRPRPPSVHYTCPRGFHLYKPQATCLQFNPHDKTWDRARAACQSLGADLVSIYSADFSNYIKAQIQSHRGKYWIGLHDRHHENRFQWLDSNNMANFTNWHPGHPNNQGGNANCVAIYDQDNYQWWDRPCYTAYHYICQIKPGHTGQAVTTTTQKPWSPNCGPHWEDDPNSYSCYMFNTERLSWLDARLACQAQNGDLLSINSVSEQFYINGRISSLNSNFLWTGANDRQTEQGWRWADGSPMAFINWKPREPNNQGNSDCVGISKANGQWSDFRCTDRYGYICEKIGKATPKPTAAVTSPVSVPSGKTWGCGRGWRGFSGQCYQWVRQDRVSWQTARVKCGQRGSMLASIHSDAENKFVVSMFPSGYKGTAWLGLNDLLQEGSFAWSDTTNVAYTHWNTREPSNVNNEHCVAMFPRGGWSDYSCTSPRVNAYFCKKPMSLQSTADIAIMQGCATGLGFRAQCYVYINTPTKTWRDAQSDCRRRRGNLATINDRQIQAFVSAELVYRSGTYWMGLKNAGGNNNTYVWVTNYAVDFTAWAESHTGNEVGTCVAITTGRPVGLWANFQCNQHMPYICELPRKGFTTPPPTPPSTVSRLPCPPHWKPFGNICIKAFNMTLDQRLSWTESRAYCQSLGGDLLSVWGKHMENVIITRVLNNATDGVWWIGLNDRDSEQGHVWSDDHGVGYTHWLPGEPNDYHNREDCVEWKFPENGWNDENCYLAQNFICSIPRGTMLTTTAPPPTAMQNALCQNSTWVFLASNCYFLSPESGPTAQQTWYEARRTCQSMGADLASVHSVDENGFLTTAMSKHSYWTFWLGLNDLDQSDYSWTDGTPVNFISWQANEPNDAFGGESCVESTSKGEWNDENCQDKNSYICKRPLGNVSPTVPSLPPVTGGCPPGYTSIPILEKCYKIAGLTDDTRKNFTEAITACQQMLPPAKLASIHNYIEQRYLVTLTAKLPHFVWIGLNDMKRRNYFEWQDNSEVDFTHWGPQQPDENVHSSNPDDRRDCVALNPQARYAGNWNDMACGNRNHYVCQLTRVPTLPTLQPANTGCPPGYSHHRSNCYKFVPTPTQWAAARAACQREGGDLATLTNRFQLALLTLLRMPDRQHVRNVTDIWIGLTMPQGSKSFQWINGWPVKFTKWADREPDNTGSCVKMDVNAKWHDHTCDSSYPFICQISQGGPPPTTSTVNGVCPDNTWSVYGEYCYQLITSTQRSWPEARYACSVLGAGLASVHSQGEMDFITGLFSQATSIGGNSAASVWLGLSKGLADGFSWTDGSELEYDNWDQGEPSDTDNGQHQDCVEAALSDGTWNDVDCFDANFYLCKVLQERKTTMQYGTSAATYKAYTRRTTLQPQATRSTRPLKQDTRRTTLQPQTTRSTGPLKPVYSNGPWSQWTPATSFSGMTQPSQPTASQTQNAIGAGNQQQQTDMGSAAGGAGLSGGDVAGIVLGTLALVAVAGIAVFFLRGQLTLPSGRQLLNGDSNGFDNALYSKTLESTDGSVKGSVSFGVDTNLSES